MDLISSLDHMRVYRFSIVSTFDSLTGPLLPSPSPFYTRLTLPGPEKKNTNRRKQKQGKSTMSPV